MKAHYLPAKSGDEQDALSRKSRQLLCVFQHAGVARAAKRSYARRIRQDGRRVCREVTA